MPSTCMPAPSQRAYVDPKSVGVHAHRREPGRGVVDDASMEADILGLKWRWMRIGTARAVESVAMGKKDREAGLRVLGCLACSMIGAHIAQRGSPIDLDWSCRGDYVLGRGRGGG